MTRETFYVDLEHANGMVSDSAYAWNSSLRRGESLVREYARAKGTLFHRGASSWDGDKYRKDNYRCEWSDGSETVIVTVKRGC